MDGRTIRATVPRSAHAGWEPPSDRDPLAVLHEIFGTLIPDLLPLRVQRMSASPFAFFRGSAAVMAHDLASTPRTGIVTQISGDAHVANFGGYASPERRLVFDVNDFDETVRGPWEWDVKRLAASLVLAGRERGFRARDSELATRAAIASYRDRMASYAAMPSLDVWYTAIDLSGAVRSALDARARRSWEQAAAAARRKTALALLPRITQTVGRTLRFIDDPPLLDRNSAAADPIAYAKRVVDEYRQTLRHDARILLDRFTVADCARKVVGVGSVGTWCALLLLLDGDGNPLLLQAKEARASALEPFVDAQPFAAPGERVVGGQRAMQAASDALLGWADVDDRCVYVRQYRDMKAAPDLFSLRSDEMQDYGMHCAWALARAHARTGDARAIAAYIGRGNAFVDAIATFAAAYADQATQDHTDFVKAVPHLAPAAPKV
ncbi:MAG TPA: DUF2252 domain-containing protein [Candidatus Elarobacter sp.]|jgi:uncharacterized protein (DUF2252 family)|nr:DUF2252 domain-containing protein [Candidatus Elarobacter sp.]